MFFDVEFGLKLNFHDFIVSLGPFTECFRCVIFNPVSQSFLKQAAFLIPIISGVNPSIEPSGHLHVSRSRDKISHHFLTK